MAGTNLERLIQLADEVFAVRTDPEQLSVNEKVMQRLHELHPATVSEYDDGSGPAAWLLVIPTTAALMNQFLENEISEKELFELTPLHSAYDALYLCSALVLPEYRRRGIIKQMALDAVVRIRRDHPLKALFVWAFTAEGDATAEKLAQLVSLPLYKKVKPQ